MLKLLEKGGVYMVKKKKIVKTLAYDKRLDKIIPTIVFYVGRLLSAKGMLKDRKQLEEETKNIFEHPSV